jgi:hypothetical protein
VRIKGGREEGGVEKEGFFKHSGVILLLLGNGTVLRARFFFFFFSLFFFFFQSLFPSPPGFHPPSYSLPFPLFFSSPSYPSYSGLELLEYKGGIVFGSYIILLYTHNLSLSLSPWYLEIDP